MNKKQIGRKVKNKRIETGTSYYKIAQDTGVQRLQVKAIEEGENQYTIDSLINTCQALGMEISILEENKK